MKLLTPKQLYRWLIKDEYDIIVSYLEGPCARIAAGAPSDKKVVSYIHITIPTQKDIARPFRSFAEAKKCYNRADVMVYVSKTVMDVFQSNCPTNNNIVLYNTNETDDIIEKSKEPLETNLDTNVFHWCSVGKLTGSKGFDRMLKIQKRLCKDGYKTHFHALGIGELKEELEQWCVDNNLTDSVTFWGYQTNPYKFVANCDLYVCASHAEGFSTSATESLIVGTPVCTVEVSGMKEMLGENNEWGIVTDNDDEALYEGIKKLLDNPQLLAHYREMAILRGRDFSTEKTVKAVENMLNNL